MIDPRGKSGTRSLGGPPAVDGPPTGNVVISQQVATGTPCIYAFATAKGGSWDRGRAECASLASRGSGAVRPHEHKPPTEQGCGRLSRRNAVASDRQTHDPDGHDEGERDRQSPRDPPTTWLLSGRRGRWWTSGWGRCALSRTAVGAGVDTAGGTGARAAISAGKPSASRSARPGARWVNCSARQASRTAVGRPLLAAAVAVPVDRLVQLGLGGHDDPNPTPAFACFTGRVHIFEHAIFVHAATTAPSSACPTPPAAIKAPSPTVIAAHGLRAAAWSHVRFSAIVGLGVAHFHQHLFVRISEHPRGVCLVNGVAARLRLAVAGDVAFRGATATVGLVPVVYVA